MFAEQAQGAALILPGLGLPGFFSLGQDGVHLLRGLILSLDAHDGQDALVHVQPDQVPLFHDGDEVGSRLESETEKRLLIEAVEKLNGRERFIMQMRFGLLGGKEMTQKEVADIIGISQSYISRLEKRILKELKKELEAIC